MIRPVVWSMVDQPFFNIRSEARVFDYFRRFVFLLPRDGLAKLFRFVIGSSHCGS